MEGFESHFDKLKLDSDSGSESGSDSGSGSESDHDEYADYLNAWVLYTIREVMGVGDIRIAVLKYYLETVVNINFQSHSLVEYGPTFSLGTPKAQLYKYLDYIIASMNASKDKIILFTCNNSYGPVPKKPADTIETHYQTFIVQTKKKRITMADPSRKRDSRGIYVPHAAMTVYCYIKPKLHECNLYWLKLSEPCQVDFSSNKNNEDVYCQSWSLFLQKEALSTNRAVIEIPYLIDRKYDMLIEFYQQIVKNIPLFVDEFKVTWKQNVKRNKINDKGMDMIKHILNMTGDDLYSNIDLINVESQEDKQYVNIVSKKEVEYFIEDFINFNKSNYEKILSPETIHYLTTTFQNKSPERAFIISPETKTLKRRHSKTPPQTQRSRRPTRKTHNSSKLSESTELEDDRGL